VSSPLYRVSFFGWRRRFDYLCISLSRPTMKLSRLPRQSNKDWLVEPSPYTCARTISFARFGLAKGSRELDRHVNCQRQLHDASTRLGRTAFARGVPNPSTPRGRSPTSWPAVVLVRAMPRVKPLCTYLLVVRYGPVPDSQTECVHWLVATCFWAFVSLPTTYCEILSVLQEQAKIDSSTTLSTLSETNGSATTGALDDDVSSLGSSGVSTVVIQSNCWTICVHGRH